MKKFAQTAVLVAGLVGLSACASDDVWTPYGTRTAGEGTEINYEAPRTVRPAPVADEFDTTDLRMCRERENRLLSMNRECYRK